MKQLIFILVSIFFFANGFAQPGRGKIEDFENYKAQKVSYMTEKLELTPEEAQQFWPTYNEFDKKRFGFHHQRRDLEKKVKENYSTYKESDFRKINLELVDLYKKESDLMREYNEKFLKLLPVRKVVMIGPVENDFRFNMIREFKKNEKK